MVADRVGQSCRLLNPNGGQRRESPGQQVVMKTASTPKRLLSFGIREFLGLLVLGGLWGLFIGCLILFTGGMVLRVILIAYFPDEVTIPVPGTEYAIVHSSPVTHILPAKYDREITYLVGDELGAITPMTINTAGAYPINCYLIHSPNGPFLRLEAATGDHLLDLQNQTTYMVSIEWAYELGGPAGSRLINGALIAQRPDRLLGDTVEEEYLGRIEGWLFGMRFIPASRSPEREIKEIQIRDW